MTWHGVGSLCQMSVRLQGGKLIIFPSRLTERKPFDAVCAIAAARSPAPLANGALICLSDGSFI
jgi:hypothetical protein